MASIPTDYKDISLDRCDLLPMAMLTYGREWAQKPSQSLYFYGTYGCGKTSFAVAIIRQLMSDKHPDVYFWPRYMTGRQLDNRLLQACKSSCGDDYEMSSLCDIDLLFIDDMDKIDPTQRFKSQFFELINGRQTAKKITVITTNVEPNDMSNLLDGSVISRMRDLRKWQVIEFPKKDLRKSNIMKF